MYGTEYRYLSIHYPYYFILCGSRDGRNDDIDDGKILLIKIKLSKINFLKYYYSGYCRY
jgi:hypothetical protein